MKEVTSAREVHEHAAACEVGQCVKCQTKPGKESSGMEYSCLFPGRRRRQQVVLGELVGKALATTAPCGLRLLSSGLLYCFGLTANFSHLSVRFSQCPTSE